MNLLRQLWKDDQGIVAMEYLFVATIIGLGLVVGLSNAENALNVELTELGNAILGLNQGYGIVTQTCCKGHKHGSHVEDTTGTLTYGHQAVTASSVDVNACP